MLKRLTNTKRIYITCAVLAAPVTGSCGSSSEDSSRGEVMEDLDPATSSTRGGVALENAADTEGSSPTSETCPTCSPETPGPSDTVSDSVSSDGGGQQAGADQQMQPSPDLGTEPDPSSEAPDGEPLVADAGDGTNQDSHDVATDTGDPTAEEVQNACFAVAGDGPCENCVCESCVEELEECAATAGCPEILECVLESGCTGLDCYCGDESLPLCAAGQGNGPCRDAVLSAPGGRRPDILNPSGGPASDAALAVSDCSADVSTCGDVCDTTIE